KLFFCGLKIFRKALIWVVCFDTTNFNLANSIVNSFLRPKLMLFFNNLHQINSKNYVIRANIS
ncbi:TPA: hypothetical protein ACGJNZ_002763, partial [Staphylococcus aureus]